MTNIEVLDIVKARMKKNAFIKKQNPNYISDKEIEVDKIVYRIFLDHCIHESCLHLEAIPCNEIAYENAIK